MAEADEKYDGIDYEAHIQKQRHRGLQRRIQCDRAPPGTYKSLAEVQRAKRDGTFDIHKTMFLRNGRLFFMCYE